MTNEARLKTAIDYLESEVKKNDMFIVDSFKKDFSEIDSYYQDDIFEEIISQFSKPHYDQYVDIGGEFDDDGEYGVGANYGVFDEMWYINILVWNYTKNKFEVNISVRMEWDDDEPVEYKEHQQYLKKITENFLRLIGLTIDKRLGSLYFLKMDWKSILKAKTKRQQDLTTWTNEEWGSQEQHRAKAKGKTPKSKTKGRYMPKATYQKTPKATLDYQDRKKREGTKKGKQHIPTGKKFSQK